MRKCVICTKDFEALTPWNKKTCSNACHIELVNQIAKRAREKRATQRKEKKCQKCSQLFEATYRAGFSQKYCSMKCMSESFSEKRKGITNPAYRNGYAMTGKRTYTGIHLRACSKYRKAFMERCGYLFCEVCKVNVNGTPKFEVHHIYFASLWPKHQELHNPKNLVLVCISCHNKFHGGKQYVREFRKLERERGLKKLFATK